MIEDPERTAHNGGGKSSNRYVIACANKLQDQVLPKGREESKERSEETTVYIQPSSPHQKGHHLEEGPISQNMWLKRIYVWSLLL